MGVSVDPRAAMADPKEDRMATVLASLLGSQVRESLLRALF